MIGRNLLEPTSSAISSYLICSSNKIVVDKHIFCQYVYTKRVSELYSNRSKKEDGMAKSLTEMAAEIVAAQASHAAMSADEMDAALKKTFEALQQLKGLELMGEMPEAAKEQDELAQLRANPAKSIHRNYVINLEDGKKYKQLTARTLAKFGLTPREYRKKWGFSARQPLSAKALTAKRRKTAKALGLGARLQKARKARAAAAAQEAAPKRVVRRRRKAESPSG
jgi:predicted transcriptional regulator